MFKIAAATFCLLALICTATLLWSRTAPKLSPQAENIIKQVFNSPLPELVTGQTGFAQSDGIKIWYEVKDPIPIPDNKPKGTFLLINGLGSSALFWPEEIYVPLQEAGYRVVLTDHRGSGLSERPERWSRADAYQIKDLMKDNLAVLDALNIQQVHLLGVSLGGMIAQELAIRYPERVLSLSSIMSTGFAKDPDLPQNTELKADMLKLLVRYGFAQGEENVVKLMVASYNLFKGEAEVDIKRISQSTLYELRQRSGFNHQLANQQEVAIEQSGSRYAGLKTLQVPTLVVHGESDPVLDIAHAKKYAALIPNAQTLWVKGMGHALEPRYVNDWMISLLEFSNNQS